MRPPGGGEQVALEEIVEDNVSGRLSMSEDPAALADAIRELLSSPKLAEQMGAAGRARVLRERTWAANVVALSAELGKLGVTI